MKKEYIVEYSDCSFIPTMSLGRITEIVENMFSSLTLEMGCDNISLREKKSLMWVFTKQKINVYRSPRWEEKVYIECNIIKTERLKNYFLLEIKDVDNNVLVTSYLEACVINISTFRITKLEEIGLTAFNKDLEINIDVQEVEEKQKDSSFAVTSSLIDYSQHLNNTKSIYKIYDTFSLDELNELTSSSYEFVIKYVGQGMINQKVDVYKNKIENGYFFELDNEEGKALIKANLLK